MRITNKQKIIDTRNNKTITYTYISKPTERRQQQQQRHHTPKKNAINFEETQWNWSDLNFESKFSLKQPSPEMIKYQKINNNRFVKIHLTDWSKTNEITIKKYILTQSDRPQHYDGESLVLSRYVFFRICIIKLDLSCIDVEEQNEMFH